MCGRQTWWASVDACVVVGVEVVGRLQMGQRVVEPDATAGLSFTGTEVVAGGGAEAALSADVVVAGCVTVLLSSSCTHSTPLYRGRTIERYLSPAGAFSGRNALAAGTD